MDCDRVLELLPGRLDATLEEPERTAVEAHLRECSRCAAEDEALKETLALLRNLPPVKAPPALLEGVRRRIAAERPAPAAAGSGRFPSARFRIPFEAAAAVLLFLLVYGIQRQFPATEPPPKAPARVESASPAERAARRGVDAARAPETASVSGSVRKPASDAGARKEEAGTAEDRMEAAADSVTPAASGGKESPAGKAALPAVPATRVSTGAETLAPKSMEEPKSEAPAPFRVFAAPPSRLLRPLPYGRELILEVAAADRAGIEERILRAVERFGGSALREFHFRGLPSGEGARMTAAEGPMRVQLPAGAAEPFLSELRKLGTVPPEAMAAGLDLPAGPTPDTVAYTIRIRVR